MFFIGALDAQAQESPGATSPGELAYRKHCAACHEQAGTRTPSRDALSRLSQRRILRTLDFGLMMSVAYPMRREEREAVAHFIGKGSDDLVLPPGAMCAASTPILSRPGASWASWSATPANTRFQESAGAGLVASQLGGLKLKWAYAFAGDVIAFAAPTIVQGTLFVGSAGGTLQALDARTGCIHWTYEANGPVRAPPTVTGNEGHRVLLFADQIGTVYALDASNGRELWTRRVESHEATRLTGAIAVHGDIAIVPAASWEETRAFDIGYPCCTFRGSITALRVQDGSTAWKTSLVDAPVKTGVSESGTEHFGPSGAGVWSAPTVDAKRGVVYIATGDNYSQPATSTSDAIIALDLATGQIVWTHQVTNNDVFNGRCGNGMRSCGPDHDFGAPAMLVSAPNGREVLVAGQKSGLVYGLDPDDRGRQLWRTRVGVGGTGGGVQWGMASDGHHVYAAVADPVRQRGGTSAPQVGNASFDPEKGGGLTALDVLTGKKAWFVPGTPCTPPRAGCSPAQPGAVSAIPGAVFSGSMDGHVRAFSASDGSLLWDFDTQQDYVTVNGQPGRGGSLDGAGPVIVDGMLFVNSGYARLGGAPGNVLLAFGLEGASEASRVAELEDRESIRLVLRDYGRLLDERRFDDFGRLFSAEGEYFSAGTTTRGPQAIADSLRRIMAGNPLGLAEPNFHVLFNERIEVHGDQANATSQSFFVAPGADGAPRIVMMASYEDSLVRTPQGWRFARRVVRGNMAPRPTPPAPRAVK
jgi:polyvinyl alcohol dehydrogenase (cytochrome)